MAQVPAKAIEAANMHLMPIYSVPPRSQLIDFPRFAGHSNAEAQSCRAGEAAEAAKAQMKPSRPLPPRPRPYAARWSS